MCGIVGYIGSNEAVPIMLRSLQMVTYRGYDSFGVAALNGHGIEAYKRIGTVEQHHDSIPQLAGTIGIGHTRWATVGQVCDANAHPHLDCTSNIAVVHNGDIDNFRVLKERLQGQGHHFRSETDSEVIAHLIEAHDQGDIVAAVQDAAKELEGSFALVVLHQPTRSLLVARRHSPLVIGFGETETFVGSDVPALLPYTRRVAYLQDGDVGLLTPGGITVWQQGREVVRSEQIVEWDAGQLERRGYAHFMLKEINEQPEALTDTLAAFALASGPTVQAPIRLPSERPDEIILLACGTSYHAALLAERLLSKAVPIPVRAYVASEFEARTVVNGTGLAIAFTQSGETADTISALQCAKTAGYQTIAITNVVGSSITRLADEVLLTHAGPEVAVAATKTFTAQLAAGYALAAAIADAYGVVGGAELLQAIKQLPAALRRTLDNVEQYKSTAATLAGHENLFIIAKGLLTPIALEGALKFKEVAYQYTEGCPAGELKHGPFALLGAQTPVIALVGNDEHRLRMVTAIREVRTRGSLVVAVADELDAGIGDEADYVVRVPRVDGRLAPAVYAVALQLLSYYSALERGCPIDRPRNLAKSVTVH